MSEIVDSNYDTLLEKQGYEIISGRSFGGYQGDYLYLLYYNGLYGFVIIGYGSCSGCDALQACNTQEEVDALMEDIVRNIHWGNIEEILAVIEKNLKGYNHNWYNYESTFNAEAADLIKQISESQYP
jgi:hypothetical protein